MEFPDAKPNGVTISCSGQLSIITNMVIYEYEQINDGPWEQTHELFVIFNNRFSGTLLDDLAESDQVVSLNHDGLYIHNMKAN